jgi:hypothetical protein
MTNTTKEQTDYMERMNKIMNEPIESLLNNLSMYTSSSKQIGL